MQARECNGRVNPESGRDPLRERADRRQARAAVPKVGARVVAYLDERLSGGSTPRRLERSRILCGGVVFDGAEPRAGHEAPAGEPRGTGGGGYGAVGWDVGSGEEEYVCWD